MSDPRIIDPFHRELNYQVSIDLENRKAVVASGGVHSFDAYQRQVGYIEALQHVLELAEELERDRYGKKPGAQK